MNSAGRERDMPLALMPAHPGRRQGQHRAQALAAGDDDMAGQFEIRLTGLCMRAMMVSLTRARSSCTEAIRASVTFLHSGHSPHVLTLDTLALLRNIFSARAPGRE